MNKVVTVINYIVGLTLLVCMCCMDSDDIKPFAITAIGCLIYFAIYGFVVGGIFYEGED